MRFHLRTLLILLALSPPAWNHCVAEDDRALHQQEVDPGQWGDLELRFVFDGDPPKPKAIAGAPVAVDESLLVNSKDRGIANVAVWLRHDAGSSELPVHPRYRKTAAQDVAVGIVGDALVPRVAMVRTTQKITFINADPHGHNIRADAFDNASLNHLLPAGESTQVQFRKPEPLPMLLNDAIQPWLRGYIHVSEHPYHAVSNAKGELLIPNLPKGEWTFIVWHERAGYVKEAQVGGNPVKWERGRWHLDIQSGRNNPGEIKLAPGIFNK